LVAEVCKFLEKAGSTDVRVEQNKHIKVKFTYKNKHLMIVMSSTPSKKREGFVWSDVKNTLRKANAAYA